MLMIVNGCSWMIYLQSMDVNGGSKQTKTNKKHSWWMLMMDTQKNIANVNDMITIGKAMDDISIVQ